ncbi:Exported zinc metalloprotease YfgC precursor [hydrothermal vent metagenome]|uniref:Exported zinc metalloprotease YfgC n=1 Tax=hydrothermal vent metagenome TaxID=652676 RepID=A0A3B1BE94_9ZZZZ
MTGSTFLPYPTFQHVLLLILSTVFLPLHLQAQQIELPEIGASGAASVTPVEEYETGKAVVRNIRRGGGVLDDPLIHDYINNLGYSLIANSDSTMKNFYFFMVNDGQINAFALPGGFIGINYGLLLASESESELASVIAHEIAHVTQRHHARAYEQGSGSNIPAMAALIAAIILGGKNYEIGEAALATMAATSIQSKLDFTRANEKEADYIGIALLSDSNYNPFSMASFFEKLDKNSRLYGESAPEFLRTHPVSKNRVADARNRARTLPRQPQTEQKNYLLIRSRLRVLASKDKVKTLGYFKNNLAAKNYLDRDAENYGYTLSLIENKQFARARKVINKLLKQDPHRIAYLLTQANLETRAGNFEKAEQLFENALALYPGNLPITQNYAEALLKAKNYPRARKILREYLRTDRSEPMLYKLLAEAENKLGHKADSMAARGEYYYLNGQPHQALSQLKGALRTKGLSFYDNARIEGRIQQMHEELALLDEIFSD